MSAPIRVLPMPRRADRTAGFGPESCYPPAVWLPVLGPAAYLTWRHLARIGASGVGAAVTLEQLAADLGLGSAAGNQSGIGRALRRLERFGAARRIGDELVLVAVELPPLPAPLLERLPAAIRDRHTRLWRNHLDAAR